MSDITFLGTFTIYLYTKFRLLNSSFVMKSKAKQPIENWVATAVFYILQTITLTKFNSFCCCITKQNATTLVVALVPSHVRCSHSRHVCIIDT
jgi:hypothetical protein